MSVRMTAEEVARYNARRDKSPPAQAGIPPTPEYEEGEEIKSLHEPFAKWCDVHQLLYVHSRSDRATTNECGVADFVVMHLGMAALVEFKAHENPEKKLSKAQRDWRDKALAAGIGYIVTNSVQEATKFCIKELELVV